MNLEAIGWSSQRAEAFEQVKQDAWIPGRIVREGKLIYQVLTEGGALLAEVSGKYRHRTQTRGDFPVIGDWVAVQAIPNEQRATIHALLPRQTSLSRKVAGETTEEQLLAANVDVIFLVSGLDGGRNLNVRRIERFLPLAAECGAQPVVVLNKADLCGKVDELVIDLQASFPGLPIHPTSALQGTGMGALLEHIHEGRTAVLLGPSGVGKSALVNALTGNTEQIVGEVREKDKRGRHTTTRRELFPMPDGGALIDTPGLREIRLWADEESVDDAFDDILALAETCRFRDCRHEREPGCAVQQALAENRLEPKRYENYLQLRKEAAFLERKRDVRARMEHQRKWKQIAQQQKLIKKFKDV